MTCFYISIHEKLISSRLADRCPLHRSMHAMQVVGSVMYSFCKDEKPSVGWTRPNSSFLDNSDGF